MTFSDGTWLNPPPDTQIDAAQLTLTTGDRTDFWQDTHYGFRRDDGHFLGQSAPDTFDAQLHFEGDFTALYDQAGLMLRQDPQNWIKAGIEVSDGLIQASCVVTRAGRSDWSVQPLGPVAPGRFGIRVIRVGAAVMVHRPEGAGWVLMRLADFPAGPALIGPTACTPERVGLTVTFSDFSLTTPPSDPLHLSEA
ncbi:MAG: DUF1349 domain-containing protein [Pseudomonadota bacterium]